MSLKLNIEILKKHRSNYLLSVDVEFFFIFVVIVEKRKDTIIHRF